MQSRIFPTKPVSFLLITLLLTTVFLGANARGMQSGRTNGPRDPQGLFLIPTPQTLIMKHGVFRISGGDVVAIASPSASGSQFSAQELIGEIESDLGIHLRLSRYRKNGCFLLGLIGKDSRINSSLRLLGLQVPYKLGSQGYILNISPEKVIVAGNTATGVFYGVQTLKQIIRANRRGNSIPCLTIVDWPGLKYRGWMDDISRGPIPKMKLLKKEIRTMAGYKQNFFNLYTENVFKLKNFPDIAPADGITAKQVKELTRYAAKYHIQLMGNFQSFAHMGKILEDPFYHKMRETDQVISPAVPQTYKFLAKVYSEVVPAYSSKFFNIDCDETYDLGQGKAKAMVDSIGMPAVYAYHITRIYDLLKPYHKRVMFWGDIAARNKGIISKLPKGLIALPWDYSASANFDNLIKPFTRHGFSFMVAPGVSCWSQIWPDMGNAVVNISNFVRDGASNGAIGMMNTIWDDDGENLFNYNWHGLLWGAECSWKPASPVSESDASEELDRRLHGFDDSFDAIFYDNAHDQVAQTFFQLDSLRYDSVSEVLIDPGFWKAPLDFTARDTIRTNQEHNRNIETKILKIISRLRTDRSLARNNAKTLDYAIFAAKRVLFEVRKDIFSIRLRRAMLKKDQYSVDALKPDAGPLLKELHSLKMEYVGLWQRENRTWWLNHIMERYDDLGDALIYLGETPFIKPSPTVAAGKRTVTLGTVFKNKKIYYTTDGSVPTLGAALYTHPFTVGHSTLIQAATFEHAQLAAQAQAYILVDKAIGKPYRLVSKWSDHNPAYSGGEDSALVDGLLGSTDFTDGRWQGFQGQNVDVILDMEHETSVKSVGIRFLQNSFAWIMLPKEVKILFSNNGRVFHLEKVITNTISQKLMGTLIHRFTAHFEDAKTRYIQIIGVNPGVLPSWHPAAGNPSFLFTDEVIVH